MAVVRFVTPVRTCLLPEGLVEDMIASLRAMPWESGGRSAAVVFAHGLELARGGQPEGDRGRADTLTLEERNCILRALDSLVDRYGLSIAFQCVRDAITSDFSHI
jgi:hypothetical protein